ILERVIRSINAHHKQAKVKTGAIICRKASQKMSRRRFKRESRVYIPVNERNDSFRTSSSAQALNRPGGNQPKTPKPTISTAKPRTKSGMDQRVIAMIRVAWSTGLL